MPADLLTQDREILTKSTPVHLARDGFMHAIICYTLRSAPIYSWHAMKCDVVAAAVSAAKTVAASLCEASGVAHRAPATERTWKHLCQTPANSLGCLYSFEFIISAASAEVRTGTISKSTKSRQFAVHLSNSVTSSVCMSCQQVLKPKSIQLEMYSNPSGIIRPFSRKRR